MKVTLKMRLGAKAATMKTINGQGDIFYYPAIIFPGTRGRKYFLTEPDNRDPIAYDSENAAREAADRIVREEIVKAKEQAKMKGKHHERINPL